MKTFPIKESDLVDYFTTVNKNNSIRKFRKFIIKKMPRQIRLEFKTKFNDLKEDTSGVYKIFATNASTQLSQYLSQFSFMLDKKNESKNDMVRDSKVNYLS